MQTINTIEYIYSNFTNFRVEITNKKKVIVVSNIRIQCFIDIICEISNR